MFNWITYRNFYHPIEELSLYYATVLAVTLLTGAIFMPMANGSVPGSIPPAVLFTGLFAAWSWLLLPFAFPAIRAHLIRRNLSGIGLEAREVDYAVQRHLLTVEEFYFHVAYELAARGDSFRKEELNALCIDYEHLSACLRKAIPAALARQFDYEIRDRLLCKRANCKCRK